MSTDIPDQRTPAEFLGEALEDRERRKPVSNDMILAELRGYRGDVIAAVDELRKALGVFDARVSELESRQ